MNGRDRFAKWVFLIAGVYGILVLAPQYLVESRFGPHLGAPITRPEHFYGFVGVALTWQFVFLLVASDVRRFRPLMLIGVAEKLSFALPTAVLFAAGRVESTIFAAGLIDLALGTFFLVAFFVTRPRAAGLPSALPA